MRGRAAAGQSSAGRSRRLRLVPPGPAASAETVRRQKSVGLSAETKPDPFGPRLLNLRPRIIRQRGLNNRRAGRGARRLGHLPSGARKQPLRGERHHPDGDWRHADLRIDGDHQFRARRVPDARRNRRLGSDGLRPRLHSGRSDRRRVVGADRLSARARSVPVHA